MKTDVTNILTGRVLPRGNSVCCSPLAKIRSMVLFLTVMLFAGMTYGQQAEQADTRFVTEHSDAQEPIIIVKHEAYPGDDVVPAEVQAILDIQSTSSISPMSDPPPSIDHCPDDRTVECFSDVGHTVAELEYSIFCGPAAIIIVYEPAGILETGSCPGTEYTVTYSVWDQCGEHTSCDQIFTLDNPGPQITFCPEGGIVDNPGEAAPNVEAIQYEVSCTDDTLCAVIDVTVVVDSTYDVCTGYTFTNTYTITDGCGRTDQCVQVFEIPPTPLSLTCPSEEIVACPEDIVFDPEGLLITGLIPGVEYTVDSEGPFLVSGAGPCNGAIYELVYTVEDECGRTASCTQTFHIVNDGPSIEGPDDITVDCSAGIDPDLTGMATAEDPCQGDLDVTYDDEVVSDMCPQVIERTFSAINVCGDTVSFVQTITIEDTTAPELSVPADVTVGCNDSLDPDNTGAATATDDCHNVEISYVDGPLNGDCPEWFERTWTAVDECGNESTGVQTITILDDEAPVISCPDDITVDCASSIDPEFTGYATATDECSDVSVTYVDGDIMGECEQTLVRTWTATDACGNTSTCEQTITIVDDTAPEIFCPADITVDCAASLDPEFTGYATAIDDCNEVEISYVDGDIMGDCEQTLVRTWTATDACGNASSCEQIITIVDDTAPVISCPDDISVSCTSSFDPLITGFATATDDCNELDISYEDSPITGAECQESFVRTWTAVDACGNYSFCEQTITLIDDEAPVISCPDDITVDCAASIDPEFTGYATATDECSSVTVTYVDGDIMGECEQTLVRTWTAMDACGNTSTCEQTITIVDDTAPEIFCPADITVDCAASLDPEFTGFATAEDDCNDVDISYVDGDITGECEQTLVRTWTAVDACGNASSCEQIITIVDDTAPVISCPDDITVDCASSLDPEVTGMATATDDCNEVSISYNDVWVSDSCPSIIERTFTATDLCGNTSSCTQTITITFDVPTITAPEDVIVECASDVVPNYDGVVYTTACDLSGEVTAEVILSTDDASCPGTVHTIVYTVTDACGRTASDTQTFTIDNEGPSIEDLPAVEVECVDDVVANFDDLVVSVSCDLEYEASAGDPVLVEGEDSCDGTVYSITYTVEDECGRSVEATQIFNIVNDGLVITSQPEDMVVSCYEDIVPNPFGIEYTAPCSSDVFIIVTPPTQMCCDHGCPGAEYQVVYTVFDQCGNEEVLVQTFTIDNDGPFIISCGESVDVDSVDDIVVSPEDVVFEVSCGVEAEVTVSEEPEIVDNGCAGIDYIYEYTVTDICGRTAVCTRTFTVPSNDSDCWYNEPCNYRLYYSDIEDATGDFVIWNVVLNNDTYTADLTLELVYPLSTNYVPHIGLTSDQKLYIVDVLSGMFMIWDTENDVFVEPGLQLTYNGSPLTGPLPAVLVSEDNTFYVASTNDDEVYTVDPVTGIATLFASVPVQGGDLVEDADGEIWYINRSTNTFHNLTGGAPDFVVPESDINGAALLPNGEILVAIGDLGTEFKVINGGVAYDTGGETFDEGDLAGRCTTPEFSVECYADFVYDYSPGTQLNGSALPPSRTDGTQALGAPERTDANVFATLGYGGVLTLGFEGLVINGAGDDLEIVETSFGNMGCAAYPEYVDVYLSLDGVDFHFAKTVCKSDQFVDISDAGAFTHIKYVRLVNNDGMTSTPDGYDVDGIVALYGCDPDTTSPDTNPDGFLAADAVEHSAFLNAYPNPATDGTNITFHVPTQTMTTLEVYDMSGRMIQQLFAETAAAELEYIIDFDTSNLPSGIYVYKLKTSDEIIVKKFMVQR